MDNVKMSEAAPWMTVLLENGVYQLVSTHSVPENELNLGNIVMVADCNGDMRAAKIVALSSDGHTMKQEIHSHEDNSQNVIETPKVNDDAEIEDYSTSGSSWVPDHQSSSESENEIPYNKTKPVITSKRTKSKQKQKKQRRPILRPEPVLPHNWSHTRAANETSVRKSINITNNNNKVCSSQSASKCKNQKKSQKPQSLMRNNEQTQTENINQKIDDIDKVLISQTYKNMLIVKDMIKTLKNICIRLRTDMAQSMEGEQYFHVPSTTPEFSTDRLTPDVNAEMATERKQNTPLTMPTPSTSGDNTNSVRKCQLRGELKRSRCSKTNRKSSTDNVPSRKKKLGKRKSATEESDEHIADERQRMVPIGSGKTLVSEEVYSNINWNSYTMATRKLLMAVFSRRTLATHSLTGKASPAFTGKPAKLCLDPKKVADIVMTVTANCRVKESLVRSAITTKCADENKMFKLQAQRKSATQQDVADSQK